MSGNSFAGAQSFHAIGQLWETVGLQIGALQKNERGELVLVDNWDPFPAEKK